MWARASSSIPTPPDCEAQPTRPGTGATGEKVAFMHTSGSVFTIPTQLGPTRRMPVCRHCADQLASGVLHRRRARRTRPRSRRGRARLSPRTVRRPDPPRRLGRRSLRDRRGRRCRGRSVPPGGRRSSPDAGSPGRRGPRSHPRRDWSRPRDRRNARSRPAPTTAIEAGDRSRAIDRAWATSSRYAWASAHESVGTSSNSTPPTPASRWSQCTSKPA